MVIACYRPQPGQQAALADCVRDHLPLLRRLGLATARPALLLRAADGTLLEIFEWVSEAAVERAHHDPQVAALWERFAAACDLVPMADVPGSGEVFAHFDPADD